MLVSSKGGGSGRRCIYKLAMAILLPAIVIGIVIAVMLPRGEQAGWAVRCASWVGTLSSLAATRTATAGYLSASTIYGTLQTAAQAPHADCSLTSSDPAPLSASSAPDAKPTQVTITNIKLNGFESLTVDMDIAVAIENTNKQISIGFDPVNVTYAFPANPDEVVGRGTLEGGEVPPGGSVERPLSSSFTAPWSLLGTCLCVC